MQIRGTHFNWQNSVIQTLTSLGYDTHEVKRREVMDRIIKSSAIIPGDTLTKTSETTQLIWCSHIETTSQPYKTIFFLEECLTATITQQNYYELQKQFTSEYSDNCGRTHLFPHVLYSSRVPSHMYRTDSQRGTSLGKKSPMITWDIRILYIGTC